MLGWPTTRRNDQRGFQLSVEAKARVVSQPPTALPSSIELRCRCGAVRGGASGAGPRTVNRAVCYCDDCQAFAHHLGRADLLDAGGGSDIVQLPPALLTFRQGHDRITGVRLTPKGLHRFYASCCNTPLGNMVSPAIPFVGVAISSFELGAHAPDQVFGKPVGAIMGEYAIGEPPAGSRGIRLPIMLRSIAKVLGWRLAGKTWPHPFFDRATGKPRFPVTSLTSNQREALRPLCGPRPAPPAGR